MTTESKVTHPPVTHPETSDGDTTPAPPTSTTKPAVPPPPAQPKRKALRVPPLKVLAAVALVIAALELLLWQVAGVFWGIVVHATLAVLVAAAVAGVVAWVRRRARRLSATGSQVRTVRTTAHQGRVARSPLGRLLGRSRSGGAAGKRDGLLGRLGGGGRSPAGGRSGSAATGGGGGHRGGLLGKLTGGRRGGSVGRAGGRGSLLGRLGGRSASPGSGTTGSRSASSGGVRARARGLLGGLRGAAQRSQARRQAAETRPGVGRGRWGVRLGQRATAGTVKPNWKRAKKALADFTRGVRKGAKPKPGTKPKPERPEPKHAPDAAQQQPGKEKPQPPTKEQLVKEAVAKVAKAAPAVVAPQRTGGTVMGDINKVRAAADELAAALKDYDPESMHQLVREMPQFGEALNAVQQGFRQVASRAESEWPVAAPVAEGLRSIADDIKAGAGTAEETRGTIRRENETDIERGEAPRHGSIEVERKWNV